VDVIIREILKKIGSYSPGRRGKYKVVVIGNCQARPIAQILTLLNPDIAVIAVAVVHLLKSEQVNEYLPYFEKADLIISQLIADNYRCDFIRTGTLRNAYGNKLITIINLYYSGYNPELIYIRNTPAGTLKSPLWEYHSKTFLDSWKEGIEVEETVSRYFDREYNEKYAEIILSSMEELKRRELLSDIQITDVIENDLYRERLFFTFNHPCMSLMMRMCMRILDRAMIEIVNAGEIFSGKEALDKITMPVNLYAKDFLHIEFNDFNDFKGVDCDVQADGKIALSKTRNYSVREIVGKYFEIYDKNLFRDK